jgi:hypothetical protein
MLPLIAFGQIDSVIIGSVEVDSGCTQVMLPLYVTTVDTLDELYWQFRLVSPNDSDAFFVPHVQYFFPLTTWDWIYDTTMQDNRAFYITGFARSDPGYGPFPLFTNNQRLQIITFSVWLDPDMPPRQVIVDSLMAIHAGRNGTVFIPGIIDIGATVVGEDSNIPFEIGLLQNYPNPFNAQTTISYSLQQAGPVTLSIYNIMGQKVATLFDGVQQAGEHKVVWDAGDVTSGVYFGRLESGINKQNIKLILLR